MEGGFYSGNFYENLRDWMRKFGCVGRWVVYDLELCATDGCSLR